MCGICGVLDPQARGRHDELDQAARDMAATIVHRGPDGSGVFVDDRSGLALGHRRLSVVDLTDAGAQPMVSADERWAISFNGEVYDQRPLAARLEAEGVRFRGHADTEVLLEAIAAWGLRTTLERVEGMFAFALWDRRDRRLSLVRDRLGEKPLYWGRAGTAIVFGSSLDALRAHPRFDPAIDPDALCGLLRYKYVPAPLSIYRDAHKLEPGHLIEVEADGSVGEPEAYWRLAGVLEAGAAAPFSGNRREATERLDELLRRSVEHRRHADVPVGAFLSGGIDSSTVVAYLAEASPEPVPTFSIGSPDADFDESADARRVAEHLGADHHELIVTGADALAVVDELPRIYDEPFADSSQIPTFLLARLARESVTVALTGDGADEQFGGYHRHRWLPAVDRASARVPGPLRRGFAAGIEHVGGARLDHLASRLPGRLPVRQVGGKLEKLAHVVALERPEDRYLRVVSHWSDPERAVRHGSDPSVLASDPTRWPQVGGGAEQLMAVDLATYLPDDILAKVDRATMAVGLEGRMPFLDRQLVEFAASLPAHLRIPAGPSKPLLRDLLHRRVPAHLVDRPKTGFGIPLDDWLRGPLRAWGEELLSDPRGGEHLNRGVVRAVWHDHQRGHHDHGHQLWDVLAFLAWSDARRA